MRAYVVATGTRIAPFGDLVRDLPVGGVPLHVWQKELFLRFGIDPIHVASVDAIPVDDGPSLVVKDNLFFTRRVLKSFLAEWGRTQQSDAVRVALPLDSGFIRHFSALQDYGRSGPHALFDMWGVPASARAPAAMVSSAPLPVIYKERILRLPVPRRITGVEEWTHPITSSVCLHLRHWLHLLQANLLSIQIRWVDEVITHPLWATSVLLRGLPPFRGWMWRVGAAANRIGRGADIHPTARVEGSFIGAGVRIGPQCLVRGAIVGPGSVIEQRADVSYSVLGPRTFVSKHSIVYATAAMEDAELCMKGMQMCLVGRRASLTARASPIDTTPGRKLRVRFEDEYVEIDIPVLGSCYGHDSFIGADLFIGPGRAIPNGIRIVPQPERVLSTIPDDADPDRLHVVRGGALTPL